MYSVRQCQFETNSSTVNQIVINNEGFNIDKSTKVIFRLIKNVELDTRYPLALKSLQEKVELVIVAISTDMDVGCALDGLQWLLSFYYFLKKHVDVEVDIDSFKLEKEDYYPNIDYEIMGKIQSMIASYNVDNNDTELKKFLFTDKSFYASDDNGTYYDQASKVLIGANAPNDEFPWGTVYTSTS